MRLKRELIHRILKGGLIALAGIFVLSGIFYLLVYTGGFGRIPGKKELSEIRNEEASLVYSSDSLLIGKYFASNRTNISRDMIPQHLIDGLIATEDRRFFSHNGYDSRSYLRVFLRTILLGDQSGGGGSTITQQLVKNLLGRSDHGWLSLPVNKLKELIIARRMESIYTKDELLTLYLNSVPFGEEVYGIESASRRYFSKSAALLKIEESAVLVGMLKANTRYNPRSHPDNALQRRNVVLSLMEETGSMDAATTDSLMKLPLEIDYENLDLANPAGYFVYQVRKRTESILEQLESGNGVSFDLEKDGLKIFTTLDMQLQEITLQSVKDHLPYMQKQLDSELDKNRAKDHWIKETVQQPGSRLASGGADSVRTVNLFSWDGTSTVEISGIDSAWHYERMLNASVLVTEPSTGAIRVWIGGNNFRYLPFDMVLSHRQSASVFKPFVYATAIENGTSPCTYLENRTTIMEEYDDWNPENADRTDTPDSTVAAWYALAHSMNLPTLDLYMNMDTSDLQETCEKLGFPIPSGDAPSVALGTLDLSLYDINRAYSTFANEGWMQEPVMIESITDADGNVIYKRAQQPPTEIFSEKTSQLITAMLTKAVNEGTGARIRTMYGITSDLAGKTGTAQEYSDAWFVSYTPGLVMSTWVGARSPSIHFNSGLGSGSSLALPVIAGLLKEIENSGTLQKNYLTPFDLPAEVMGAIDCNPFKQKGIRGLFNRIFGTESASGDLYEADSANAGPRTGQNEFNKPGDKDKRPSLLERIFKKR